MGKISPIKERILTFLAQKGITKAQFYKETGLSDANFKGIGLKSELGGDKIVKILSIYPDISADWLLMGLGEMLKTKGYMETITSGEVLNPDGKDKHFYPDGKENQQKKTARMLQKADAPGEGIPLIPLEAAAGFPIIDGAGIALEDCDRYIVPDFQSRGAQFLIRVSGNSMYPRYASGDILACRKIEEIRFIQWGKVYVIDSSQGQLVKMVFEDKAPEYVLCVSENSKDFPPFRLPKDDIRSLSTVIGCIKLE